MQVEVSFGLRVGGDPLQGTNVNDVYNTALRFTVPVHRGVRSDISLLAGGGFTVLSPVDGGSLVLGSAFAGGTFRAIQTPSLALIASLGVATVFRDQGSYVANGARPLGAAGVIYYFR